MKSNNHKPTYEELLQKTKDQELEIIRLNNSELHKDNLDFYFKASFDLVCKASLDGFYKEINSAFIKTLGYSKKELLTRPLISFIHPEDKEKSTIELATIAKGISTFNFENRLIKKNGGIVFIQWTTSIDTSKKVIYAIGRDITIIKKTQAELLESKKLLDNAEKIAKIGSWEYNFETDIMIWSNELYSLYKLKKAKNQDLFQEYVKRFSKSDVEVFLNKIKESKINKKTFEIVQCSFISKNKSKWLHAIVHPVTDEKGIVITLRGTVQDITEKKQIDEILKLKKEAEVDQKLKKIEEESNAKFKTYIENSPDGIVVVDEKGNYVDVNNAAIAMTGYSKKELLKLSFYDLLILNSKQDLHKYFKILKDRGSLNVEYKARLKSGEIRWRWLNAIKLSETRYLVFIKDITEIKKSNNLIEINEKRFRALVENNNEIITIIDKDLNRVYRNTSAIKITGYSHDERKEVSNLDYVHPDFIEYLHIKYAESLQKPNIPIPVLFRVKHKLGYYIWLEGVLNNKLDDNSINGIIGNFRDVTLEKNAKTIIENNEKRFRSLVENNEGIINILDKDLKVLFRSHSSFKITGYTDEEIKTLPHSDYFHPDYMQYINQVMQKSISNPDKIIPVLFKVKHKKGHYIWLEGVIHNKFNDKNINGIIANLRDVSNRIETNVALKKERDVFAKIAATSPGLIYSMSQNIDGSISCPYASDAVKEIYGFSFEEIKINFTQIFNLIHPDDIEGVKERIFNTKTSLVPLKAEYRYFHPTKGLVWHEVNSLPIVEPDGSVVCHGVITDITERYEANQKIVKANRLYLFISQMNQMIVRTIDKETLYSEACKIAVELGEFKMAWIGIIDPNSTKIIPIRVAGNGQEYFNQIRAITIDDDTPEGNGPIGTAIKSSKYCISNDIQNDILMQPWRQEALDCGYQSLMAVPIKKFGKVIGIFAFYAGEINFFDDEEINLLEEATGDVSFALELIEKEKIKDKAELEVFESEKRYHTLTEVSPVGIFRTDVNGNTTFVNSSWCEISGISFEKSKSEGWIDGVHQEDKRRILKEWKSATSIGKKSLSEYRFVRPDGSISWVMGQAIPEVNERNEIIGYIGTITDISDRKALEANLIIAKEVAETANKSKSNFLANMSHEIRTPLNGIIGFTHLLMKTNLDDNQLDYMSTINISASLLMKIINDVLDFSKIESGKLEIYIEEINLHKLLNQIIDLFKFQVIDKKIELILDINKNVPQFIMADAMKLKQILINLLSNAIKFTEFGEIRLEVIEQEKSKDNISCLKFSVKDTGKGIKQTNFNKIFNSFEQEDNSTNRKFGGTGLGLAISNQLLGLMDSKLELNSIYGEGTDFFFLINVRIVKYKKNDQIEIVKIINKNKFKTIENNGFKKILIAEDNKINMFLIQTLIKKIIPNATIFTAFDGNEAIEKYMKEQPDLILMDIQMPNKNGYEATTEIRTIKPNIKIPIIAVTAGILTGEKEKCFEAGLDDYLPKPIVFSDLEKILFKWLKK